jgi:hypothetical protein
MKKADVTVGMSVTLTEPMYGQHFGRKPVGDTWKAMDESICRDMAHSFHIQPGMVGIVASVDVPRGMPHQRQPHELRVC